MSDLHFHGDSPFPELISAPASRPLNTIGYHDALDYNRANHARVNQLVFAIRGQITTNSITKCDIQKIKSFEKEYNGQIKAIHNYYESDGLFGKIKSLLAPWFASWYEPDLVEMQEDVAKLTALHQQLDAMTPFGTTSQLLNSLMENNQNHLVEKTDLELSAILQKDIYTFTEATTVNGEKLDQTEKTRDFNNDPNWENYLPEKIKQFLDQKDQRKLAALCFTQAMSLSIGAHLRQELNTSILKGDGNYTTKYFEKDGVKFLEIKAGYLETELDNKGFIDYTGRTIDATTMINLSDMNAPVIFKKEIR